MESMTEMIIHHYPASPVSEKIRAGMGIKKLTWRCVEQNRLPDRPELFAMTGGYRRIPVIQVGAALNGDRQVVLEKNGAGWRVALSGGTDGPLFKLSLEGRAGIEPTYEDLQAVCWFCKTYSYKAFPLLLPLRSARPLRNHFCHATPSPPQTAH